MNDPKGTPGNFEDVKKLVFRKIWLWIKGKPLCVKIGFGAFIIIIFVGLCRFNFLGPLCYRFSRILIPVNISIVDPQKPAIALILNFEVEGNMGRRIGKLGDSLYTGDRIFLSFSVSRSCWISIFCLDSKGIHAIVNRELSPIFIEKKQVYTSNFMLDDTVGYEIYFAIASEQVFDFEQDIKPYIFEIFPDGSSKGPVLSKYELKLPEQFVQKTIYFNHLSP